MNIELNQEGFCLKPNQVATLRGGLGRTVVCDSGSVWVTQDGDPRDVILRAGESFTLDRKGPALLQAFAPGSVRIAPAETHSRTARLSRLLKSALSGAGYARGALGT